MSKVFPLRDSAMNDEDFAIIGYALDTIQDFLCKLGMKPHMHLVEISIFSLNHVIVRPTKIIKDLRKAST